MTMNEKQTPQEIKDAILLRALNDVPFDGWTLDVIEAASKDLGYEKGTIRALFPSGLADILAHFSNWADRAMLETLRNQDRDSMRIRDRIRAHVLARLQVLEPHKEAVNLSLEYYKIPTRQPQAAKMVWKTADIIWNACGDTTTDYNHYTKRALLSGILGSTTLVWLRDENTDNSKTIVFLDKRIENVMQFGKIMGKLKKRV